MTFASPSAVTLSNPVVASLFTHPGQSYACVGVLFLTAVVFYATLGRHKYDQIPAIGAVDIVSVWSQAAKFRKDASHWLEDGYKKYKSHIFRIPQGGRWHVIVTGDKLVEELRRAPEDTLNITAAFDEILGGGSLIGETILKNRYHVPIIRNQLTRNLSNLFNDIREEVVLSIEENIPLTEEWTSIHAYAIVAQIISRTSNRLFVGAPLCRDPEYMAININHTLLVGEGMRVIQYVPNLLRPLAVRYLTGVSKCIQEAVNHLRPIIEERQHKIDEYGTDYPDKPNDFLSWLMDEAKGEERSPEHLTNRILHINFASIHTSSMSFTHALYELASQPRYLQPLREEVEAIIETEGWTKSSVSKMRKLDSFLKESQRYNGISLVSIQRKALKDYTFSDGTHVPKGVMVSAAAYPRHHDDEVYANAASFDPFRFSRLRTQEGLSTTNQLVNTNADYLSFGHGSHACPGRFFVANEMKLMMAHLILNYDIKMEKEGQKPLSFRSGFSIFPDTKANVLFRRRRN